jgi:hypothetical protein
MTKKTQIDRMRRIRKEMPPPSDKFVDRKKEENKKRCRSKKFCLEMKDETK